MGGLAAPNETQKFVLDVKRIRSAGLETVQLNC
jgi:hypothetical protein